MIPVDQRSPSQEPTATTERVIGDCFNAAVASILELSYEDVPHFVRDGWGEKPESDGWWFKTFEAWALERGLWVCHIGMSDEAFEEGKWVPPGYWLASVTSPRNKPEDEDPDGVHAVVMRGRALVWDPHPGPFKGEHRGFRAAVFFVPLDPALA